MFLQDRRAYIARRLISSAAVFFTIVVPYSQGLAQADSASFEALGASGAQVFCARENRSGERVGKSGKSDGGRSCRQSAPALRSGIGLERTFAVGSSRKGYRSSPHTRRSHSSRRRW